MAQVLINIPDEAYKDILQNEEHYRIFEDKLHVAVIEGKLIEPNGDAISRKALLDKLEPLAFHYSDSIYGDGISRAVKEIEKAQAVAPPIIPIAEIKLVSTQGIVSTHGKWVMIRPYKYKCDICGCETSEEEGLSNFCPDCGADMRGDKS